ncbi:MAG: DUF3168 domain-containing protein [Candidatus Accumulibacter phosphatis]
MSAETDLFAALSASAALAAIVGTKIYPDAIPEDKAPPAVVYQRANTSHVTTVHSAAPIAEEVRFSITAWAKTRAAATGAADAVADALVAVGHTPGDRADGIDQETGLLATTLDVDWFHVL